MSARFVVMVVLAVAGSAVIARAGEDAGEPGRAAQANVLRLPAHSSCVRSSSIRVAFVPGRDQSLASLTVRAGRRVVLQLAGLTGPGSVAVSLPRGTTRVAVSATDGTGRFLENARSYRRCGTAAAPRPAAPPAPRPKPKPKPRPRPRPKAPAPDSESSFQVGGGSA